jgi:hypothetical protein
LPRARRRPAPGRAARRAARRAVALAGTGELEVDGVRRRQLLRAFDEGRRLVLVVGALGLCEQLADAVDQPVAVGSSQLSHLDRQLAVVDAQGEGRLGPEAASTSSRTSAGKGGR